MKIKTVLIIISTVICTVSCNNGTKDEQAIETSLVAVFNGLLVFCTIIT